MVDFARDVLGEPLDPWQEWLVIRAGELLPDGTPRFRRVLVIVGRQNGKSHLVMTLALYWLFEECQPQILGTANKLEYAKKLWMRAVKRIRSNPELMAFMKPGKRDGIRGGNNDVTIETADGCEYTVAAANEDAGRSLTVNRLLMDEIRALRNMEAYSAAYYAMNAVDDAQAWFITTEGEDGAVLLDYLRKAAEGDEAREDDEEVGEVGAFIWAAPEGAETDDPEALAAANPNWGRRGLKTLLKDARDAKAAGGLAEANFRTEVLCLRVSALDPAIDGRKWDAQAKVFEIPKDRRAGVVDVSGDLQHVTFAIARMTPGEKVQVALVKDWTGPDAIKRMRAELPALAKQSGIQKLGYLPMGPAAAYVAAMKTTERVWPAGLEIEPITADVPALCMGLAEQVTAGELEHLGEELLDRQVKSAGKKWSGKRWQFEWSRDAYLDAAYAAAGAVHLARTMKASLGKLRYLTAETSA